MEETKEDRLRTMTIVRNAMCASKRNRERDAYLDGCERLRESVDLGAQLEAMSGPELVAWVMDNEEEFGPGVVEMMFRLDPDWPDR